MRSAHRLGLEGEKFGSWTVKSFSHKNHRGELYWDCQCVCGAERAVRANVLTSGKSTSCGCHHRSRVTHHGMTKTRTFKSWDSMKQRCLNPNAPDYERYGGRGVTIHPPWVNDFAQFLADMGERPEGMSLDRIETNGDYEPGNCRWATKYTQQRNKARTQYVEFGGVKKSVPEWSEEYGIKPAILRWRIENGWDVRRALTTPATLGRGKKAPPAS